MTDQTESASEHAELLRELDLKSQGILRLYMADAARAVDTIRALEAKAAAAEAALQELLARIHRDGGHYAAEHGLEKAAEDADALVADLFADRDRIAGEVERLTSAIQDERETSARLRGHMFVMEQEDARLSSELAKARENEARYRWLTAVYFDGTTSAFRLVGPCRTPAELDAAIDAARRAGERRTS